MAGPLADRLGRRLADGDPAEPIVVPIDPVLAQRLRRVWDRYHLPAEVGPGLGVMICREEDGWVVWLQPKEIHYRWTPPPLT